MKEIKTRIKNRMGLHARPAAMFVETARKFDSKIIVKKGNSEGDAKNILQVLSLGVDFGDEIAIIIDGPDEDEAAGRLINLIDKVLPEVDK